MDIAKYAGLFLIKNEYCYLPGIGSLQVIKKPAKYEKDAGTLSAPEYTVIYQQGYGSIDDSFANFIANNERISIAHASNFLKDYCQEIKQELLHGEEVIIPAIGTFKMGERQVIEFITDPHLNVKGKAIPVFKSSAAVEQRRENALSKIIENTEFKEPKGNEEIIIKPPTVNWGKIILLGIVALGVIAAIVFFATRLMKSRATANQTIQTEASQPVSAPQVQQSNATVVSEKPENSTLVSGDSFVVAIQQYNNFVDAERRMKQLNSYGNKTLIWTKDSSVFYIISRFSNNKDKQRTVDSLKRLFNPNGTVEVLNP